MPWKDKSRDEKEWPLPFTVPPYSCSLDHVTWWGDSQGRARAMGLNELKNWEYRCISKCTLNVYCKMHTACHTLVKSLQLSKINVISIESSFQALMLPIIKFLFRKRDTSQSTKEDPSYMNGSTLLDVAVFVLTAYF